MNGEGRRQLPSWMQRPSAVEQASVSEVRRDKKEEDLQELGIKASQPRKTVEKIKHESAEQLDENNSHLLKKCEGRKRGRRSMKQDGDQIEVNLPGDEPHLLKKCRTSKRKRTFLKHGEGENDEDGSVRKRSLDNAQGRDNKKKARNVMVDSHDATVPSEDEFTVEDLVSIAEEYVSAHMKELQNSQKLEKAETKPPYRVTSELKTNPNIHKEDIKHQAYTPIPSTNSLTDIYPSSTGKPPRDMLDLFFGPLLRRPEEIERNNVVLNENIMLHNELCKRSQNDVVAEIVPEVKKKSSLRERVAKLLD